MITPMINRRVLITKSTIRNMRSIVTMTVIQPTHNDNGNSTTIHNAEETQTENNRRVYVMIWRRIQSYIRTIKPI